MKDNGHPPQPQQKPTVMLLWDPETQAVTLSFDQAQIKNWCMVIALLDMAKMAAEQQLRQAAVAQLQQQAQEAAQAQAIARQIKLR